MQITNENIKVNKFNIDEIIPVKSPIIFGIKKDITLIKVWASIAFRIIREYPNPILLLKILDKVRKMKNEFTNNLPTNKLVEVDGRAYISFTYQGFPSPQFYRNILLEARKLTKNDLSSAENIRMVFIAITKKCPLKCEHCYEWDALNKRETLSLNDLKAIVQKFQDLGVPEIQLGGGEPLVRIDDLVELIKTARKTADFWISTSGFNLTLANALKLKSAGLTGVSISLDHHNPEAHNAFRGFADSFEWVLKAVENAHKAKLVVTLSVCTVRSFCTEENLMKYAQLAKKLGAAFIQLIEPRAVGHYAGKDVMLYPEHEKILEDFYMKMNNDPQFIEMPLIDYVGYKQRRNGCAGSGFRYLFVDTDGFMNSCPFCRSSTTHVLDGPIEESINRMKNIGCAKFSNIIETASNNINTVRNSY